ncbi:MAG: phosphopantetheine-binding protein [Desulfobacteraceae bacterium]|jgi:polyketide biosynthesis acyl carrier protein
MTYNEIFDKFKQSILLTIPKIDPHAISLDRDLSSLGANSIDRVEIIVNTLAEMNLRIPLVDFGNKKDIKSIIDHMYNAVDH